MNKYLSNKVDYLDIENRIIKVLNDNSINLIKELYIKNRKELKGYGLSDRDINQIIIKLQLIGLDLNGRKY